MAGFFLASILKNKDLNMRSTNLFSGNSLRYFGNQIKKETELTNFIFLHCNQFTNKTRVIFLQSICLSKNILAHIFCTYRKALTEYGRVTEAVENYVSARFYILFESVDLHFNTMLGWSNK